MTVLTEIIFFNSRVRTWLGGGGGAELLMGSMEFPPVWLDEGDFGDIELMMTITNECSLHLLLKYSATCS
jgi:hypothetical protein